MTKFVQFFIFLCLLPRPSFGAVIEHVVAIVNEEAILQSDFIQFESKVRSGAIVDDLLTDDPKKLLNNPGALLQHMINEKIIDSEIKRKNLNISFEQVEKEINKIAKRNGISRSQLSSALKEQGTDFSEYQDFIKKRLERQALIEQTITSKIKISDEDILSYYLSQRKGTNSKDSYEFKISHIFFSADNGSLKEAEVRAKQVLGRLKKGESFEALASRYSEDPNFTTGGTLGTFKSGEFLSSMESALKKINVGQVTELVKTDAGVHILKLLDRKVIADPQLDQEKESIRQVLYQEAFKKQFTFWLEQKKREAFIRVNEP